MTIGLGQYLRHWRIRRILRRHPLPHEAWQGVARRALALQGLDAVQLAHLRELTTLFVHRKSFSGAQGLEVSAPMQVAVAAQACLLVLHLGLDYYDGWREVILYPGAFRVRREQRDPGGLVRDEHTDLTGESWSRGPVILSWDDVARDTFHGHPGYNVVLHEFAHKLDALNGAANGMPPLHADMKIEQWTGALSGAYDGLRQQLHAGHGGYINAYAATSPAEFFAVLSEYFFTAPRVLREHCPAAYEQLALFYRVQDGRRF